MSLKKFKSEVLPLKQGLYRYAYRILAHDADVKDVLQEVMIKAWEAMQKSLPIDNLEAWCLTVTRNCCLNKLRQHKVKLVDISDYHKLPSSAHSPYQKTELSDTVSTASLIIAALPQAQREAIELRDVQGMSYNEVAEVMNIDVNYVKVLLFRARKAVRMELSKVNQHGITRAQ